jgi:hypothetical protein
MTPIFLPRYPEPCKVPTNPRRCPYAKGSTREGQAPRSTNFIESQGPSPRASGAPLPAPLGRSPTSPLSSFRLKCCGPRSLRYMVADVTQTWLSRFRSSRPTRYNYNGWRKSLGVLCFFSKLTQLTTIYIEQALKQSNEPKPLAKHLR